MEKTTPLLHSHSVHISRETQSYFLNSLMPPHLKTLLSQSLSQWKHFELHDAAMSLQTEMQNWWSARQKQWMSKEVWAVFPFHGIWWLQTEAQSCPPYKLSLALLIFKNCFGIVYVSNCSQIYFGNILLNSTKEIIFFISDLTFPKLTIQQLRWLHS